MTPTDVFSYANMLVLPMWVLMIFVPNWKVTQILIKYKPVPVLLSVVYVIYIIQALQIGGGMDFGSLQSVMALFTEENAVLAGWIHYLAFDMLVGMWIVKENETLKIRPLFLAPCLIGTFMAGPVGFLLFIIIRAIKK